MSQRNRSQPHLTDIVTLALAWQRDERESEAALLERERRLAPAMASTANAGHTTVALAWMDARLEAEPPLREMRQQVETTWHLTNAAMVVVGGLVGILAALGACYFDGPDRVNVLSVLAVLVGVPGLLLVPWGLAALPPRFTRRIPLISGLAVLGRAINGGRMARWIWRGFPPRLRESMEVVFGRAGRHQALYAGLQKWAVLRWSQLLALAFQVTALGVFLVLVVFTDLAFGWNTTLTTGDAVRDAQRVHRITTGLAAPWRGLGVAAEPSLQLIEESRYFRAAAEPLSSDQAARLGGWWRFVALVIGVYGVLPRAITWMISSLQLRRTLRASLQGNPGLSPMLRRLHRASLATEAETPETATSGESEETPTRAPTSAGGEAIVAVVNWSEVPLPAEIIARWWPQAPVWAAGGGTTVAADAEVAAQVAGKVAGAQVAVLILVKAWEPPLMDFIDFVVALREASRARQVTILVLPVGLAEEDGELPMATAAQAQVWRRKIAGVGDPWLRVVADRAEVLP